MFKILLPTDFSSNAENALDFAIQIANRKGGYIQLYHVYNVPTSTGSFISVEKFIKEDCEKEMSKIIKRIEPLLNPSVIVDYTIISGSVISNVCNKAEKDNYNLIMMGTLGSSGLKGKLFGSNASGIMKKSKVPLIAIPKDAVYQPISKILLAVDDNPISDGEVLKPLKYIKDIFDASLTIFHLLMKPEEEKGIHPSVLNSIEYDSNESTTHSYDKTIHKTIEDYAQGKAANLLCLIKRDRGYWQEFLNPSVTKKELGKSTMPLMILHD